MLRKWYHGKKWRCFPHPPPSPIPSLTPWSTGWRPGIRKGSLQLGYGLPKAGYRPTALECKKQRLGFRAEEPLRVQRIGLCSRHRFRSWVLLRLWWFFGFLKLFWTIVVLGSSYKCACVFWPNFSDCLREGDLQLCQEHNKGITPIGSSMGHSKRRPSCNSHRFQVQAGCIIHLSQVLLSPFFLFLFFFPAVWASCSFPVLLNR